MQNPEFLSGDRFASGKKEKRKLSASPEVSKNTTQAEAPSPEEKKNTGFSAFEKRAAKVIRILSVPPLMAGVLVLILSFCRKDVFPGAREIVAALLTLTVFPILAYPVARLIPALRRRGREGERNTAFLLCFCDLSLIVTQCAAFYQCFPHCTQKSHKKTPNLHQEIRSFYF